MNTGETGSAKTAHHGGMLHAAAQAPGPLSGEILPADQGLP